MSNVFGSPPGQFSGATVPVLVPSPTAPDQMLYSNLEDDMGGSQASDEGIRGTGGIMDVVDMGNTENMRNLGGVVENAETHAFEAVDKPYHSKRPHKKSRAGCKNCKSRKVKCDEARPRCKACTLRSEACVYLGQALASPITARSSRSASSSPHSQPTTSIVSASLGTSTRMSTGTSTSTSTRTGYSTGTGYSTTSLSIQPLFQAVGTDAMDMKLLWFYTTKGFHAFSIESSRVPEIDEILQVKIPQQAFSSPFLMDCLLGLSALHMDHIHHDPVPADRAIKYRAAAFAGYRRAVEEARPETFQALLACSLLLCALATDTFRQPDPQPFYILDWMVVWRGIGLIVDLITPQALFESGMILLFTRPPINEDLSARHTPNNLLFMVASIREGDDEFPYRGAYYSTLKVLGALYADLALGWSRILELRIITFFTFLPMTFVEAARKKMPRALVIIAHWLAFAKLSRAWWMEGISDREIYNISSLLSPSTPTSASTSHSTTPHSTATVGMAAGGGEDWATLLQVPLACTQTKDATQLGRLLLDNRTWEPVERDEYLELQLSRQPAIVDNSDWEFALSGKWARYSVTVRKGSPASSSSMSSMSSPSP